VALAVVTILFGILGERIRRIAIKMPNQEIEVFKLTTTQLNILIATYYEDVGWIPEDHRERRGLTPEIRELVNSDLLYITNLVREAVAVHSIGDGSFVKFVSGPASSHCAVAITVEGKKLVEQVNLSRRADACISAEGGIYVIRNFVGNLTIKDLPELLSSEHQQLREEATTRLKNCLGSISKEDLPELLTDSDSVIRDAASAVLVHSNRGARFDAVDIEIEIEGEVEE